MTIMALFLENNLAGKGFLFKVLILPFLQFVIFSSYKLNIHYIFGVFSKMPGK